MLTTRDASVFARAVRKYALCFVRLVVDCIPTLVLVECLRVFRQGRVKRERILLRALLELYQDMPLEISTKELNEIGSCRRL